MVALSAAAPAAFADGSLAISAPPVAVMEAPLTVSGQGVLPSGCTDVVEGYTNCHVYLNLQHAGTACDNPLNPDAVSDVFAVSGPAGAPYAVSDTADRWVSGNIFGFTGPGAYVICGYLNVFSTDTESNRNVATAQVPLTLRDPRYSVRLHVPRHAVAGKRFTATVTTVGEAPGDLTVQMISSSYRNCAATHGGPDPDPPLEPIVAFEPRGRVRLGTETQHIKVRARGRGHVVFCAWLSDRGARLRPVVAQAKQVVRAKHRRHRR